VVLEGSGRDLFQDVIPPLIVRTKECHCIRKTKLNERNAICIWWRGHGQYQFRGTDTDSNNFMARTPTVTIWWHGHGSTNFMARTRTVPILWHGHGQYQFDGTDTDSTNSSFLGLRPFQLPGTHKHYTGIRISRTRTVEAGKPLNYRPPYILSEQ
jgi:hypothetical protein